MLNTIWTRKIMRVNKVGVNDRNVIPIGKRTTLQRMSRKMTPWE